jgi:hypothetical protein
MALVLTAKERAISQFKSFGSWLKHPETDPKSIGIGLCRCVGTAPDVFGLVSTGMGGEGPNIDDFRWTLDMCSGFLSSAEKLPFIGPLQSCFT